MIRINVKYLFSYFFLVFLTTGLCIFTLIRNSQETGSPQKPYLVINDQIVLVELAETSAAKAQGLSGRKFLPENKGMLFIFDRPGRYRFWMEKMNFALDFVFLKGGQVVDLMENTPYPRPGEPPRSVESEADFDQVLEINAGLIQRLRLEIGDSVRLFR